MIACRHVGWLCAFLVLLLGLGGGALHAAGPALDPGMVLIGDRQACLRYAVSGSATGSVEKIVQADDGNSLAGPVFPWLAVDDMIVAPGGRWEDGSPEKGSPHEFALKSGEEEGIFELAPGLRMRTRLAAAGQGVWLWELVVTNQSREPVTCHAGLAMGSTVTNYEAVWRASDGLALFPHSHGILAVAAVSSTGVLWAPPETGPLAEAGPKAMQGFASLYGKNLLYPGMGVRIVFVLVAGKDARDVQTRCQHWMRLDAAEKAFPRARAHWENWLAEGRTPFFTDPALQDGMQRSLRTLAIAMHYPGIVPRDARELLDCAEAMRVFGRDREAAAWLALVKPAIARVSRTAPEFLAQGAEGRDTLMRYASLVSRQTIASGRLAGDLDLVDAGLAAVSRVVTASNARLFPVDAVQLEAALHDGALLMRLARRMTVSERMLTNAARSRVLADQLWSSDARAWTNSAGIPDPRVVADAGLQAGLDLRYDLQYRRLRLFEEVLSPRDRALLVVAGARAFDLKWYNLALGRWLEASRPLPQLERMALWLRMIAEGSLSGSLAEVDSCSGFRLESLYRIVLEMRHASSRVASSFVFRDVRSRIRQHLERAAGRDHAFVCSLGSSFGELRSEMEKFGLPGRLEERQVLSRLNRVDRMIAGMIAAGSGLVLDTGVTMEGTTIRFEARTATLEIPQGWKILSRSEQDGRFVCRVTNTLGVGRKPLESRAVLSVGCGNHSIRIAWSFPLYHPKPLAIHVLQDTARSGRLLLENRGGESLMIRLVQSSPGILRGDAPLKVPGGGLAMIPMSMAGKAQSSRVMAIAGGRGGSEFRLERIIRLAEVIEPDQRWLCLRKGEMVPCSIQSAKKMQPDADGLIRVHKTMAGIRNRGHLSYGVRAQAVHWVLLADERRVEPVVEGEWLWYDLGTSGSCHITLLFRDKKAVTFFSGARTELVVGPGEWE